MNLYAAGPGNSGGYSPMLASPARTWENGRARPMATESFSLASAEEMSEEARAELELVNRARSGDATAFGALIRPYEARIFRLAMSITQNREDAEDVLQEAFLKAFEHLEQFQ